jgi:hypothetical protein
MWGVRPVYRVGDGPHPDIVAVQRRLMSPVVDGVYSEELAVRVRGFQLAHHLQLTGDLDETTLRMLRGD